MNDTLLGCFGDLSHGLSDRGLNIFWGGFGVGKGMTRPFDSGTHGNEVLHVANAALLALAVAFFCGWVVGQEVLQTEQLQNCRYL